MSRRTLLRGAGALGAAGAATGLLGGLTSTAGAAPRGPGATPLPAPAASGIEHVVVVMMENRSFDHFLGWLPKATGKQAGLTFTDRYGLPHTTHHLADYASCQYNDPDHSYEGGRIELGGGRCDGWLKAGENDSLAVGYYTQPDLAFLGRAAPAWTVCDQYFSATMAETYPNRFYQHAAQTDRLHNSTATATIRWDRSTSCCAHDGELRTWVPKILNSPAFKTDGDPLQPLRPARLPRGRLRAALPRLRRRPRAQPLRARRLQHPHQVLTRTTREGRFTVAGEGEPDDLRQAERRSVLGAQAADGLGERFVGGSFAAELQIDAAY